MCKKDFLCINVVEKIFATFSSEDSYALKQTFVFIKAMLSFGEEIHCSDGSRPIIANQSVALVIGAASSQVSVMVNSMLQLLKVIRSFSNPVI